MPAEISPSGKDSGKLLGLLPVNFPAIAVAPLHFRKLEADMIKAIKGLRGRQGYWSVVHLSPEAMKELEWWRDHLKMNNGRSILPPEGQETIFSSMPPSRGGGHI